MASQAGEKTSLQAKKFLVGWHFFDEQSLGFVRCCTLDLCIREKGTTNFFGVQETCVQKLGINGKEI